VRSRFGFPAISCDDPAVAHETSPDLSDAILRRLLGAGRSLVAHLDLEGILQELLEIAIEVTSAQYAAIGVLDEDRTGLERFVTSGIDEPTHRMIGDLPRGRGVLGVLIDEPRPLRLANVGDHPQSYGFPAAHPPMSTFLGVPVLIRDRAWGNLYLTEKAGGGEFTNADEVAAVALAAWAGVGIENARLYEAAESRRTELERAVGGLEATLAIALALGSETELDRVLELVVKRGRALVDARAVVLVLAEGDTLRVAASAGQVSDAAHGARLPRAGSLVARALETERSERIADVQARFGLEDAALGVAGAETALIVPLMYRADSVGVLAAFDRLAEEPGFDDEHEALLQALAASAATAVANARTVERERLHHSLRASEAERRRWARELHDETLQGLASARLLLTTALERGDEGSVRETAAAVAAQLGRDVEALRALISELRPAALDELGLQPALESLVDRIATVEGLETTLRVQLGNARLDADLETIVYRLVQEALSNVAKHAHATSVAVTVERVEFEVHLCVQDDGRGFDPDAATSGFGLVGMQERAVLVGGELTAEPAPGGGSIVCAVLPAS
jgi:signal transduction histidine kinase